MNKSNALSSIKNHASSPSVKSPLFFISAGDPSGDAHAARLVRNLERLIPNARFIGFAGSKTATTCCDVRFDLTQYAVMMLNQAILNIPNYLKLLKQANNIFQKEKPDLVILVDFPGFNWKIAQRAKKLDIPVVYFMPPQIWGWGQWRVKKMRKYVDLILSCFEFENQWFRENGCRSVFIGHPFFEESRSRFFDQNFIDSIQEIKKEAQPKLETDPKRDENKLAAPGVRIMTILPGSRKQEVLGNTDHLISIANKVVSCVPDVMPIFAAFKDEHAEWIRNQLVARGVRYPVFAGKTPELLRAATCCLGVSGSVSIEILSLCKPFVVVYRTSKLEYKALRFLKRVKYITLSNILAAWHTKGETPFYPKGYVPKSTDYTPHERKMMICPEFLSYHDETNKIADCLIEWLTDQSKLDQVVEKLKSLKTATDIIEHPVEFAASVIKDEWNAKCASKTR